MVDAVFRLSNAFSHFSFGKQYLNIIFISLHRAMHAERGTVLAIPSVYLFVRPSVSQSYCDITNVGSNNNKKHNNLTTIT